MVLSLPYDRGGRQLELQCVPGNGLGLHFRCLRCNRLQVDGLRLRLALSFWIRGDSRCRIVGGSYDRPHSASESAPHLSTLHTFHPMPQIKSNGQARPIVSRFEVPASILASEFDWTDPDDNGSFFQYRGVWYSLEEFSRAPEPLSGWDGYHGDSYFSGVVIRLSDDGESVICGTYLS